MSKLKLSGGLSSKNSVSFFLKNTDIGIEAIRQENGIIITKEVSLSKQLKASMKLIMKCMFACALFKELVFYLSLPKWLYHVPTAAFALLFEIAVIIVFANREERMYHGAEHKVSHLYAKKFKEFNIENVKRCSRIHRYCGNNLLGTIVTFQLASSISMSCFNIHIPEIITTILPFYLYSIFPFNLLGILAQLLTTAAPTEKHISVAVHALSVLIEKNK